MTPQFFRESLCNMFATLKNHIRFNLLASLKLAGYLIYPSRLEWISKEPKEWQEVSLILILNHTSLFEFVYGVSLPFSFLRELSKRLIIPVAASTMKNPFGNFVFSNLAPKTVQLTRRRDQSWQGFLDSIDSKDICIFMPEGRMKRLNGLDKSGKPMTVKTGVVDLLQKFSGKKMVIVYSSGLHHVLAPGQRLPRIFKKIFAKAELISVDSYLEQFSETNLYESIPKDLEKRRDHHC